MDINSLDDSRLLMQYFKKHDTDNNHKLDGLELLKAITRMEEEHKHDDEDDHHEEAQDPEYKFSIEQIVPIVDSILEQDDKVTDPCLVSSKHIINNYVSSYFLSVKSGNIHIGFQLGSTKIQSDSIK